MAPLFNAAKWMAAALACLALSCNFGIDPSKGRFSCKEDSDCGGDFSCRAQVSGESFCFRTAECDAAESCNGKDDDCNGAIDERFPEQDVACTTSQLGACGVGQQLCVSGALQCVGVGQATPEICDGIDNDCDGESDETFDLVNDNQHCGSCTTVCAVGTQCRTSACREEACGDSTDNDADLLVDCTDPDCLGRACDSADASVNCGAPGLFVDAGTADAGEPDAGVADAGEFDGGTPTDGGEPDAGSSVYACLPREEDCGNGADDDSDGRADCADADCEAKTCATGTVCAVGVCPGAG